MTFKEGSGDRWDASRGPFSGTMTSGESKCLLVTVRFSCFDPVLSLVLSPLGQDLSAFSYSPLVSHGGEDHTFDKFLRPSFQNLLTAVMRELNAT